MEKTKPWFSKEYIGIDKGIEMVMLENYLHGTIWKNFLKNKYVQKGLKDLNFKKIREKRKIESLV